MLELWVVFLAIAAVVVVLKAMGTGGLTKALAVARATGDIRAVVSAVEAAPEAKHPNLWDQAITTLWQEYNREQAMALMMEAARRSEAPVVQFWLKNAMEVEPEMAMEHFSEEFLGEYFKPAVAASCGRVSCCNKKR